MKRNDARGVRIHAYQDMIQNLQEMVVVTNLFVLVGSISIWLLIGDLVKHGIEQHVDSRVCFNELLEFLDDGVKLLGVVVDMIDYAGNPFFVGTVVAREPISDAVNMMLFWDLFFSISVDHDECEV